MLYALKNIYSDSIPKYLKIISVDGNFGIINLKDNSYIIPLEYDNIFPCDKNTFVLYKKGKIGVVHIDETNINTITPCEYNTLDSFGDNLFLANDDNIRLYNTFTKTIMDFKDLFTDTQFIYGYDDKYQYIFNSGTMEMLYKQKYAKYRSYYACCGYSEKGAVFYDATFSTYLYPTENGYKHYDNLIHPININNQNVINIVYKDDGIGIIDSYANNVVDNSYNNIKIELIVTATNDHETVKKIIQLPKCIFTKDTVTPIEDWIL